MAVIEGRRFSRNYIDRGPPTSDSPRMRLRVSVVFGRLDYSHFDDYVRFHFGIDAPSFASEYDWEEWLSKLKLVDFLDVITLFFQFQKSQSKGRPDVWVKLVREIFSEENVRYRIDDLGGVHFSVDEEFENNQISAIAALENSRYAAALSHFNEGQAALDAVPPQTRMAIRQTFECLEALFKLMFPGEAALGATEINKKLKPLVLARAQSETEKNASNQLMDSLRTWVIGAHQYRHAAGTEQPDNPSLEFAVLKVSIGASFARWLAEIDASVQVAQTGK